MEFLIPQDKLIDEIIVNSALRDRKIYFNSMVTRESVFKVIHLLDRLVELDKKQGTKDDIEIVLDCEGGIIYFGLALISKIIQLRNDNYKIITTVYSIGMSMGFMFSIVGSHRRALKYSTLMIHQPSSANWGRLQDMQEDIEETNRLWKLMKEIIIEYTNITDEKLEEIKQRKQDWYMDSSIALSYGCIDEILI
jgi:ATP-dependent Clp protease protease subunit